MWIAIIAAIVGIAAVAWLLWRRGRAERRARRVDAQWREPSGAKEQFVLFAAVAEAATSRDEANIRLTVEWDWGRDRDDSVELCFHGADALGTFAETKPGEYLRAEMDAEHSVRCRFDFPVSTGGAPRCFLSGNDALEFIRPFAPHAYADSEYANHFCIRFRRHAGSELPKEYAGPNGLESAILKHFGQS